jgi:hypothetical protein
MKMGYRAGGGARVLEFRFQRRDNPAILRLYISSMWVRNELDFCYL